MQEYDEIAGLLKDDPSLALYIKKQIQNSNVGASTDLMTYIGASAKQKDFIRKGIDTYGNTVFFNVLNTMFSDK